MLEWIKDKVKQAKAAEALRAEFQRIEKGPGAKTGLALRLTHFVLTGEDQGVLADLAALQHTRMAFTVSQYFYSTPPDGYKGLSGLVKFLPDDPELYLRLAQVYQAAYKTPYASTGGSYIPAFSGSLEWLEIFLLELSLAGSQKEAIFDTRLILEMIRVSGEDPDVLVKGAFIYEGNSQFSAWSHPPFRYFVCLSGFAELVSNSREIVRPAFRQKDAPARASVLRALAALQVSPELYREEVASLAVSGSKEVRESSLPLLSENFSLYRELLRGYAENGSADERFHAVRLLARFGDPSERDFLTQRLDNEKSAKVCEAIRNALAGDSSEEEIFAEEEFKFPHIPEFPVHVPLDEKILAEIRFGVQEIEAANTLAAKLRKRTPIPAEAGNRLCEALQNFVVNDSDPQEIFKGSKDVEATLFQCYHIPPEFQLIHVVRWCLLLSGNPVRRTGKIDRWEVAYRWSSPLSRYQEHHNKQIDARELAAVFRTIGLDDGAIGRSILYSGRFADLPLSRVDSSLIWPYFAERLYLFEEAFGLKPADDDYRQYYEQDERRNVFRILKLFPRLPQKLVPLLWDIALGNRKTERPLAQEALENFPDKEQKIIAALASRQQDARFAAAQWLGALQHKEAIPALRVALSKEKNEIIKEELIKSLETLGVGLEELLDIDKLDHEAEQGLKKGIPGDLDWFPFSQLPPVRWADSGKPVPTAIINWFIVQACKLKNAEANTTLRRYCSLFQKEDREQLGTFVLEAWIAKDTKPKYTSEQAATEAKRETQYLAAQARKYPQYYANFDEQRFYQTSFNALLIQPEGSQNSTKGILAVAGACCGGDAAPVVHRYIKQWFGYRAAQCKALLQVLAWIDDPRATQVILSVANRFRTKGIQEEALRQCQLLADRKGWTMDELADRTVPTASLDESGSMELDYGTRKFTASLTEEMTIAVTNEKGKVIASLPEANQSDDAEKVKQAKATLSSSRKELKSVLAMQKDRLYEALCTQRTWRFEDWDTYLRQHPIVGRYCQRLVWVAYDGERVIESFRPLADGTLTNHQDDEVTLKPETAVRLGHEETLPPEDRKAWLQHFSDYEVEPLFQQFGKATFTLPDAMKEEHEIKEFFGYIVQAFSLRNRLTKLGYTRGTPQDAGWFYDYRKTFLRLGIEAVIEFTGNWVPEENRTVALQRLYFTRKTNQDEDSTSKEIALGELPRVLLAECWNDIRMAAADGPGFAPDWEKQTEV